MWRRAKSLWTSVISYQLIEMRSPAREDLGTSAQVTRRIWAAAPHEICSKWDRKDWISVSIAHPLEQR